MTPAPQRTTSDILIVGGGLAGTAAAITLARDGRQVTLLERAPGPHHKVCGEFLSQEALESLTALGLDAQSLGAVPIHRVDVASHTIPLPFPAMSLTRKVLDEALLQRAIALGVEVVRPTTVRGLDAAADNWRAHLSDGSHQHATDVFLATGKHDLRGRPRPVAELQSDLTGFKMYFALAPAQGAALAGAVELHLFRGGYAGLQLVEGGAANLCCLINRKWLAHLGGSWARLLEHMQHDAPALTTRLAGATPLLAKPLAISSIPYGFNRAATEPHLWQLGDQAAVIPSFTGDGMSIALHSGRLAAAMYLAGKSSVAFQTQLHQDVRRQVALAAYLSRALVSPLTRPLLTMGVRLWPGALGLVARQTRIPATARAALLAV